MRMRFGSTQDGVVPGQRPIPSCRFCHFPTHLFTDTFAQIQVYWHFWFPKTYFQCTYVCARACAHMGERVREWRERGGVVCDRLSTWAQNSKSKPTFRWQSMITVLRHCRPAVFAVGNCARLSPPPKCKLLKMAPKISASVVCHLLELETQL